MIEILSYFFIFIGLLMLVSAVIGCHRLPDYFCKMHAATIGDALGCPLILFGLAIKASSLKIFLLAIIILLVNPFSSYILNYVALLLKEDKNV
jgi:multicomponent Na+:H+ antiporter subunit G